jgi:hypothetical protein
MLLRMEGQEKENNDTFAEMRNAPIEVSFEIIHTTDVEKKLKRKSQKWQ